MTKAMAVDPRPLDIAVASEGRVKAERGLEWIKVMVQRPSVCLGSGSYQRAEDQVPRAHESACGGSVSMATNSESMASKPTSQPRPRMQPCSARAVPVARAPSVVTTAPGGGGQPEQEWPPQAGSVPATRVPVVSARRDSPVGEPTSQSVILHTCRSCLLEVVSPRGQDCFTSLRPPCT